jgi:hypothetical protein
MQERLSIEDVIEQATWSQGEEGGLAAAFLERLSI